MKLILIIITLLFSFNAMAEENTKVMKDKAILEDGKILHEEIDYYDNRMRKTFYLINERKYYICIIKVDFTDQSTDALICIQKDIVWG